MNELFQKSEREVSMHDSIDNSFTVLRRRIVRLLLGDAPPEGLVVAACVEVCNHFGRPCEFVTDPGRPVPPETEAFAVSDGEAIVGRLFVASSGIGQEKSWQEIADLVGICSQQELQAGFIDDLETQSAEMLFHAPDAIFVLDGSGRVQMANARALNLVGASDAEVAHRHLSDVGGAPALAHVDFRDAARTGRVLDVELALPRRRRLISASCSFVGSEDDKDAQILCVARDITGERQAQLALRRSERSAILAQTVEYLLHEVNNPLAAVVSTLSRLDRGLAQKKREGESADALRLVSFVEPALAAVREQTERIRKTFGMLRTVSRTLSATAPESVDVGHELSLAIRSVEHEFQPNISIHRDIADLPKVSAAPMQLAEAFGAVLRNAAQAVDEGKRGGVSVWARVEGRIVAVGVEDTGPGVPEGLREKIFMPFFSTKRDSGALGLGLNMAEDIFKRLGGSLGIEEKSTDGALFVARLPVDRRG